MPLDQPMPPPEGKPTVEMAKVPPWAAELTVSVKRLSGNIDNVISAVDLLRDRVNAHDQRFAEQDERATRTSARVQTASQSDLEQEKKLADVIIWRKGVDDKLAVVATKDDLKTTLAAQTTELIAELTKNPVVLKVGKYVGTFITGVITAYLASKGLHLQ